MLSVTHFKDTYKLNIRRLFKEYLTPGVPEDQIICLDKVLDGKLIKVFFFDIECNIGNISYKLLVSRKKETPIYDFHSICAMHYHALPKMIVA